MALDGEVKEALREAASEQNQSEELTNRLIAWLDKLSDGNTSITKTDDVKLHVEMILKAVTFEKSEGDGGKN